MSKKKRGKTLKGYDKDHNLKVEVDITNWPQKAIDKIKKEIEIGPLGRKIGKIEWVEIIGEI
jgi:hypothetical protein